MSKSNLAKKFVVFVSAKAEAKAMTTESHGAVLSETVAIAIGRLTKFLHGRVLKTAEKGGCPVGDSATRVWFIVLKLLFTLKLAEAIQ